MANEEIRKAPPSSVRFCNTHFSSVLRYGVRQDAGVISEKQILRTFLGAKDPLRYINEPVNIVKLFRWRHIFHDGF